MVNFGKDYLNTKGLSQMSLGQVNQYYYSCTLKAGDFSRDDSVVKLLRLKKQDVFKNCRCQSKR